MRDPKYFCTTLLTFTRLELHFGWLLLLDAIYGKATNVVFHPKVPIDYGSGGQYTCLTGNDM